MTRTVPRSILVSLAILALAPLSIGPLQAAGQRFKPGLWEVTTTSERQGRVIDHDSSASMERKKQEGYF